MIFRKYFFNKNLFVKEFLRTKYIMLLNAIFLLLSTTLNGTLVKLNNEHNAFYSYVPEQINSAFSGQNAFVLIIVSVFSFGTVYYLFSYLFKKSSCIFYGSMPEKRSAVFSTKFLSGLASLWVPTVLVMLINVGVSYALGVPCIRESALSLLNILYQYLFLVSAFSFTASISGNFLSHAIASLLGFMVYPLCIAVKDGYVSTFLKTFSAGFEPNVFAIFPPASICDISVKPSCLAFEALAIVVLIALGFVISAKRKTENCDKFYSFSCVSSVLKYIIVCFAAMIFEIIIASTFGDLKIFDIVLQIVFAFVVFIIVQAIFQKSFKAMFKNMKGFVVFAVVLALITAGFAYDTFGVDRNIPQKPDGILVSVGSEIFDYGEHAPGVMLRDKENIKNIVELCNASKPFDTEFKTSTRCFDISVAFDLGWCMQNRRFSGVSEKNYNKYYGFVYDSKEYKNAYKSFVSSLSSGEYFDINPYNPFYNFEQPKDGFFEGLKEAWIKDIEVVKYEDVLASSPFANVYGEWTTKGFSADAKGEWNDNPGQFYKTFTIYSCFENTVKYLTENYFTLPDAKSVTVFSNGKQITVTDKAEIAEIFKVSGENGEVKNAFDESSDLAENMASVTLPGNQTVAYAKLSNLPKDIEKQLK